MVILFVILFFFKQKTAYELRISDWSSDVCSSDLQGGRRRRPGARGPCGAPSRRRLPGPAWRRSARFGLCGRRRLCLSKPHRHLRQDRKSLVSGKRVSVRVDCGGRRVIKKNTDQQPELLYDFCDIETKTTSR